MLKKTVLNLCLILISSLAVMVCSPTGDEAVEVYLPVSSTQMESLWCETNLGWSVEVSSLIVSFSDLEFTTEGETHAAMNVKSLKKLANGWLVPTAAAHPGHYAGGEVTGELTGAWIVDFAQTDAVLLGEGALLEGDYNGVNLSFLTAAPGDVAVGTEAVSGHTAFIAGVAAKDDVVIPFEAFVDIEDGLQVVGGVFEAAVQDGEELSLTLSMVLNPETGGALFDDVDFSTFELGESGVALVTAPMAAHNLLMKALQVHDYWILEAVQEAVQ